MGNKGAKKASPAKKNPTELTEVKSINRYLNFMECNLIKSFNFKGRNRISFKKYQL